MVRIKQFFVLKYKSYVYLKFIYRSEKKKKTHNVDEKKELKNYIPSPRIR